MYSVILYRMFWRDVKYYAKYRMITIPGPPDPPVGNGGLFLYPPPPPPPPLLVTAGNPFVQ